MIAILTHCEWLFRELHTLLVRITRAAKFGHKQSLIRAIYGWRVVGIPKRGSDDGRPIAIGSVIIRAWHRANLDLLPEQHREQWCGRKGTGVVQATLDWLEAAGELGSELDLAKAFDSVCVEVAIAALEYAGTPLEVTGLLSAAWTAPRYCQIHGAIAEPIWPWCGIPPGDPMCPLVLGLVLAPWHCLVEKEVPGVRSWAYMDDRSLKASLGPRAKANIEKAHAVTKEFDEAAGLMENVSKRQNWTGASIVEHLGLKIRGHFTRVPVMKDLAETRNGWKGVEDTIHRLVMVPGGQGTRQKVAQMFIAPKWL